MTGCPKLASIFQNNYLCKELERRNWGHLSLINLLKITISKTRFFREDLSKLSRQPVKVYKIKIKINNPDKKGNLLKWRGKSIYGWEFLRDSASNKLIGEINS